MKFEKYNMKNKIIPNLILKSFQLKERFLLKAFNNDQKSSLKTLKITVKKIEKEKKNRDSHKSKFTRIDQ